MVFVEISPCEGLGRNEVAEILLEFVARVEDAWKKPLISQTWYESYQGCIRLREVGNVVIHCVVTIPCTKHDPCTS